MKYKKNKKFILENEGKFYQNSKGEYLIDSSQPLPKDSTKYTQHSSTRYINVKLDEFGIPMRKKNEKWVSDSKMLPELYTNRKECCGCSACYAICPLSGETNVNSEQKSIEVLVSSFTEKKEIMHLTGAISMLPDEEGFFYPVVDASLCIRCYKCIDICTFKDDVKE